MKWNERGESRSNTGSNQSLLAEDWFWDGIMVEWGTVQSHQSQVRTSQKVSETGSTVVDWRRADGLLGRLKGQTHAWDPSCLVLRSAYSFQGDGQVVRKRLCMVVSHYHQDSPGGQFCSASTLQILFATKPGLYTCRFPDALAGWLTVTSTTLSLVWR